MVAKFSVGKSSYGDLRGVEQYVSSERMALQVLSTIIDFNAYLRSKNRTGSLSVNEGMRSRLRQSLLYSNYLRTGYPVAAAPFTSRHDEVLRGNAVDFGVTNADGSNRALYPDEFAQLHEIVQGRGGTWTGVNFGEPWHHEMATRGEAVAPYADARARLASKPTPAKPAKQTVATKPPTPKREVEMLYVYSKKSKTYYGIGETTVQKFSKSRAQTYSKSVPGDTSLFQELTSAQVAGLIQDARDRRDDLGFTLSNTITAALAAEDKADA